MKVGISIQKSLVKELLLCFFISIIPIKIYASTNSDFSMQKLRSELDYMFTGINRDSVPTGLLKDYAIEYENLDKYERNKELNDNNLCDVFCNIFSEYAEIIESIKNDWKNNQYNENGAYIAPTPQLFLKKFVKSLISKII